MTLLPLLLLLATSAAVVGAQSAVPVISSVSGCTNVGSVTYNCTFTSTVITVSGSNFPTGRSQQAYVQVGTDYTCNIALLTSTNITCTIFTEDPFAWPGPQLLNVSAVFPGSAQVSSAPFLGLSMQYPTLPVLQTITGCDDRNNSNGQFTQSCDPSFAVLTITGVGFNTIETARYVHLYLQGRVVDHIPGDSNPVLNISSDTYMTIPLADYYERLLLPDHYGGGAVALYISANAYHTNSLSVSFIQVPGPIVTSVQGCNGGSGGLQVTGCVPGLSEIQLNGVWFVTPISVMAYGVPCVVWTNSETSLQCRLGVGAVQGGASYDLTVNTTVYSDDQYLSVVPAAIGIATGPLLNGGVPCLNIGNNAQLGIALPFAGLLLCNSGSTITLTGLNFPTAASTSVQITASWEGGSAGCGSAVIVNSTTITCLLPNATDGTPTGSDRLDVQAAFSDGSSSNVMSIGLWNFQNAPVISSVSGCDPTLSTPLALAGCLQQSWITLTGSGFDTRTFLPQNYVSVLGGTRLRLASEAYNSTSLGVRLPAVNLNYQLNTVYTVLLQVGIGGGYANTFTFILYDPDAANYPGLGGGSSGGGPSFSFSSSSSSSSSSGGGGNSNGGGGSSSGLSGGAIAGIVIAGVVVLVVVLLAMLRLRQVQGGGGGGGDKGQRYGSHSDETEMLPS